MRLLDDVRLIESDILAPPTASTFDRALNYKASKLCRGGQMGAKEPIVALPGFLVALG